MASIKARLNRSRLRNDGMYPLVIQIIYGRVKRELYTSYLLSRKEFNPVSEKAITDGRNKKRATEIREINEYLIYIKEELARTELFLAERGEYTSGDIIHCYKSRNDLNNFWY